MNKTFFIYLQVYERETIIKHFSFVHTTYMRFIHTSSSFFSLFSSLNRGMEPLKLLNLSKLYCSESHLIFQPRQSLCTYDRHRSSKLEQLRVTSESQLKRRSFYSVLDSTGKGQTIHLTQIVNYPDRNCRSVAALGPVTA